MSEPIPEEELEVFRRQWQIEVSGARTGTQARSAAGAMALGRLSNDDTAASDVAAAPQSPPPAVRRRLSNVARSPERAWREGPMSPHLHKSDLAGGGSSPGASPESTTSSLPAIRSPKSSTSELSTVRSPLHVPYRPLALAPTPPTGEKGLDAALTYYAAGIEAEHAHQLSLAVNMYSKAFRLDDQVDKAYQRLHGGGPAGIHRHDGLAAAGPADDATVDDLDFRFQRQYHVGPDYNFAEPSASASDEPHRSSLIHGGAQLHTAILAEGGAHFEPQEENEPTPLASIPDEVLVVILGKLGELGDMAGIGRFAQTCKKAFLLSVEQGVWKHLCELAYQPPFVVSPDYRTAVAVKAFGNDHRDMLLRQPRVRMDGLYISVVHYVRVGSSETLWNDPVHMITYHRLIRFLADGTMLSLLSTEHPSVLVPILTPTLRMKGLHHGRWTMAERSSDDNPEQHALIDVSDLGDPEPLEDPAFDPKVHPREARRRAAAKSKGRKYDFEMVLGLGSTSRGRWNKLNLIDYFSINKATGEELPIKLLNQGPFYFSKVRSYQPWGHYESSQQSDERSG